MLLSSESVLNLQRLIFAGSPLSEVLTKIAQLVESQSEGMLCTIWLSGEEGNELHCAAALSLPGFRADVGIVGVGPKGIPRHGALSSTLSTIKRYRADSGTGG